MAKITEESIRRDSMDFRDLTYKPALLSLPVERVPNWQWIRALDQQREGACTGFGLAAVIYYLLHERDKPEHVSARILFEMTTRYDQFSESNERLIGRDAKSTNDCVTMAAMLDVVLKRPRPTEGWFKSEELKGY